MASSVCGSRLQSSSHCTPFVPKVEISSVKTPGSLSIVVQPSCAIASAAAVGNGTTLRSAVSAASALPRCEAFRMCALDCWCTDLTQRLQSCRIRNKTSAPGSRQCMHALLVFPPSKKGKRLPRRNRDDGTGLIAGPHARGPAMRFAVPRLGKWAKRSHRQWKRLMQKIQPWCRSPRPPSRAMPSFLSQTKLVERSTFSFV